MTLNKKDLALVLGLIAVLQGFGVGVFAIGFLLVFLLGRLTA
jgi:hypothetical protein